MNTSEITPSRSQVDYSDEKDFYMNSFFHNIDRRNLAGAEEDLQEFYRVLAKEQAENNNEPEPLLNVLMRNSLILSTANFNMRSSTDKTTPYTLNTVIWKELSDCRSTEEANRKTFTLLERLFNAHEQEALSRKTLDAASIAGYIRIHIFDDISVASVADHFSMSPDNLNRIFHKTTRKTVIQYIQETKVNYACRFLKNGSKTIGEIAQELHFYDSSHFTKVFHRITGYTPGEYRLRAQEQRTED